MFEVIFMYLIICQNGNNVKFVTDHTLINKNKTNKKKIKPESHKLRLIINKHIKKILEDEIIMGRNIIDE